MVGSNRALVTPMSSTTSAVHLRVVADAALPVDELRVAVDHHTVVPDGWSSFGRDELAVRYTTVRVGGLDPDTDHDIALRLGDDVLDRAVTRTLPVDADCLRMVLGSCYDSDQDRERVAAMYGSLVAAGGGTPHLQLWLGDQVYVDAPAVEGLWPKDSVGTILDRYRATWGLASDERRKVGLAAALGGGANLFLPDDHEFWDNYPQGSITLLGHTIVRLTIQLLRYLCGRLGLMATGPSHPSGQGPWGRAAGEAYCVFQSELAFDGFGRGVNPPQLQVVDVGSMVLAMADTRWHRTIRKGGGGVFMPDADLEALVDLLDNDDRLICLALSRPLLGNLPDRGPVRARIDYGPEDFGPQYRRLWAALNGRADRGRPTIVVAGDAHDHSVRLAQDDRLLEVVSSPLALLVSLQRGPVAAVIDVYGRAKAVVRGVLDRLGRLVGRGPQPSSDAAYPVISADGRDWVSRPGRTIENVSTPDSSLALLSFDLTDREAPVVEVRARWHAGGASGAPEHRFTWSDGWQRAEIDGR